MPFGNTRREADPRAHHGSKRPLHQDGENESHSEEGVTQALPGVDAPRQEKVDFLLLHKFCFRLAFNGNCPKASCPFSHDPRIVPAGHFRATEFKRRRTGPGGADSATSRPRSKLYALSDEMAGMLAAVMGEDCEPVDSNEFDA